MKANLCGLLALALWSMTALIIACSGRMPPLEITAITFFLGSLPLFAVQYYNGEDMLSYWRQPLSTYAFWLCGPGLYTALIFTAFKMAPVFEVNCLNYLWPLLLVIFSSRMYGDTITPARIFGLLVGFAGGLLVIWPKGDQFFAEFYWGYVLAVIAAFLWAGYSARTKTWHFPMGFFAPAFLIFSIICFAVHLAFEETIIPQGTEWIPLLMLSSFRGAYALWDYGMKKGDVKMLASCSYFLPFISTSLLVIFGFGPERPLIALGGILVIAGSLIVNAEQLAKLFRRLRPAQ